MKDLPQILAPCIEMKYPNEDIPIHGGQFLLVPDSGEKILMSGNINFTWFPSTGLSFSGTIISNTFTKIAIRKMLSDEFSIHLNDTPIGKFLLTNTAFKIGENENTKLQGVSVDQCCIGNCSEAVEKIKFEICNFHSFIGQKVTNPQIIEKNYAPNRIEFQNKGFTLTIDRHWHYKDKWQALKETGGYLTTCSGELKLVQGSLSKEEATKILKSFNFFLSFLTGSRVSVLFQHGIRTNGEIAWKDYSMNQVQRFKSVVSWTKKIHCREKNYFNELWDQFYTLWNEDEETREMLMLIIHWYVEANNQAGRVEGSIIMAQAALELLFNWISSRETITSKNKIKSAEEKIRLLVDHLGITSEIPTTYSYIIEFITPFGRNRKDGPYAINQVRNTFTHSKPKNMKHSIKLNVFAIDQALQLSLYYIELSLLKILKYKGPFYNRTTRSKMLIDYSNIENS